MAYGFGFRRGDNLQILRYTDRFGIGYAYAMNKNLFDALIRALDAEG